MQRRLHWPYPHYDDNVIKTETTMSKCGFLLYKMGRIEILKECKGLEEQRPELDLDGVLVCVCFFLRILFDRP